MTEVCFLSRAGKVKTVLLERGPRISSAPRNSCVVRNIPGVHRMKRSIFSGPEREQVTKHRVPGAVQCPSAAPQIQDLSMTRYRNYAKHYQSNYEQPRLLRVIGISDRFSRPRVEGYGQSSLRLLPSYHREKMPGRRVMFLPPQYAWFEPVLIATIVVFVIDLVGNAIGFGNRFLSALMSAILFALVFGTLVYFGYGSVSMSVTTTPSATAPAQTQK
jgi:hypothetical protein